MDGTEWQGAATMDGTGAGPSGERNWGCWSSFHGRELNGKALLPCTELELYLEYLKLKSKKLGYLTNLEPSQPIDTSLEYPSRM